VEGEKAPERAQRVPHSGPGAEGRSPGANRTEEEKEQKAAETKKKSKKNNTKNDEIVPLNVWAENPSCTEATVWRADTVKLLPTPEQVELLLRLAKATRAD
jgi:hypothetical protein